MENKINIDNNINNKPNNESLNDENKIDNTGIDSIEPKPINEIKNEINNVNSNEPKPINEIKNEINDVNSNEHKPINEIKNEINDVNSNKPKPINEIKYEIINTNETPPEQKNEFKKDPNKNYKIKFSALIEELRQISDKEEKMNYTEFTTNLLLMSSQINQTNKISCLTLISYINHQKENSIYTYYLNKKIFKYLKIQKSIESFLYIRTLYRAAFFLIKEENYFYARKYIVEAEVLSNNSRIDKNSQDMLNSSKKVAENGIMEYIEKYTRKFQDVEKKENLNDHNYCLMKKLFDVLNKNEYKINLDINNKENNEYLYIISKNWFTKAYQFFLDYQKVRDNLIKGSYFKEVFDVNYCYMSYFDQIEWLQNNKHTYSPFPCIIDNYSIINWTDNWLDPLNEDENIILQNNLKEGKGYFLLEKNDFDLIQNFFGVSNIIKRKKTDFIEFKAIILDKRLTNKKNISSLRKRHLQVKQNNKIIDLKEKIIRCIEYALKNNKNEYEILMEKKRTREEKEKSKANYRIKKEKKEEEDEEKKTQEEENQEEENNKINSKEYNIHFYLLEKSKRDVLMEICVSLVNDLPKYESVYLQKIDISENDSITNLISIYDKGKYILIIQLENQNLSPLFINPIISNNKIYTCSSCKNEINNLDKAYKCNICNFSLYCSEICSNNDPIHQKLDKIYIEKYLYEEFNLESFLKKDISELQMLTPESPKGMIGLKNLGNTCYMNSTIQCLSNTFDLTKYFLLQYFRNDVNTGNKLGSNGNVALKYYHLLYYMWCVIGNRIDPSDFVTTFKKLKKQFDGYRQQDAQEFLSVLLDQLHEDLNRITDKPYIELLEKQPDEDDLTASKRWWDLHKKREDSIIIDLFNGQFKSETICKKCKKSSITYDPFMSLCVPLPKTKTHLLFKIFIDTECKYLDFLYEDKSTILDAKQKAIKYISDFGKESSSTFDLEVVLLDQNKTVQKIISTDPKDKKNYMGGTELKKVLINKSEIIFFKKKIVLNEKEYINFFVYPIEPQKPNKEYLYWHHPIPLKYISYPLFFQIPQDTKVIDFYNIVLERIRILNFYIQEKYESFYKSKEITKIIELNLIHSKDTKKEGFLSWFSIEDTCKFCNQSNESNYYCSIDCLGKYGNTIKENFQKVKKPVILAATSDCYNLSGTGKIYLECDLFISNDKNSGNNMGEFTDSIKLKECLELFVSNENFQDDSWFCSKCKELQNSSRKLQIYKPPNYLIILIKRYNFNKISGEKFYGEKNNTFISYPVDNFDITEYIVGPEKDKAIYDLYGVIEHYGSINQGHYTAICKNDGNWVSYNDSIYTIVKSPVSNNAYVLFYKMKNIGEWHNSKKEDNN